MSAPRERLVEFRPAFDRRHTDPNKNYGIHGVEMLMVLKGEEGAVHFIVYTNWHLPHVQRELSAKAIGHDAQRIMSLFAPMAADLGYHSRVPQWEGQTSREDCAYLNGAACYSDGSGLQAENVLKTLIRKGGEAVWQLLEERYDELFAAAAPIGGPETP